MVYFFECIRLLTRVHSSRPAREKRTAVHSSQASGYAHPKPDANDSMCFSSSVVVRVVASSQNCPLLPNMQGLKQTPSGRPLREKIGSSDHEQHVVQTAWLDGQVRSAAIRKPHKESHGKRCLKRLSSKTRYMCGFPPLPATLQRSSLSTGVGGRRKKKAKVFSLFFLFTYLDPSIFLPHIEISIYHPATSSLEDD